MYLKKILAFVMALVVLFGTLPVFANTAVTTDEIDAAIAEIKGKLNRYNTDINCVKASQSSEVSVDGVFMTPEDYDKLETTLSGFEAFRTVILNETVDAERYKTEFTDIYEMVKAIDWQPGSVSVGSLPEVFLNLNPLIVPDGVLTDSAQLSAALAGQTSFMTSNDANALRNDINQARVQTDITFIVGVGERIGNAYRYYTDDATIEALKTTAAAMEAKIQKIQTETNHFIADSQEEALAYLSQNGLNKGFWLSNDAHQTLLNDSETLKTLATDAEVYKASTYRVTSAPTDSITFNQVTYTEPNLNDRGKIEVTVDPFYTTDTQMCFKVAIADDLPIEQYAFKLSSAENYVSNESILAEASADNQVDFKWSTSQYRHLSRVYSSLDPNTEYEFIFVYATSLNPTKEDITILRFPVTFSSDAAGPYVWTDGTPKVTEAHDTFVIIETNMDNVEDIDASYRLLEGHDKTQEDFEKVTHTWSHLLPAEGNLGVIQDLKLDTPYTICYVQRHLGTEGSRSVRPQYLKFKTGPYEPLEWGEIELSTRSSNMVFVTVNTNRMDINKCYVGLIDPDTPSGLVDRSKLEERAIRSKNSFDFYNLKEDTPYQFVIQMDRETPEGLKTFEKRFLFRTAKLYRPDENNNTPQVPSTPVTTPKQPETVLKPSKQALEKATASDVAKFELKASHKRLALDGAAVERLLAKDSMVQVTKGGALYTVPAKALDPTAFYKASDIKAEDVRSVEMRIVVDDFIDKALSQRIEKLHKEKKIRAITKPVMFRVEMSVTTKDGKRHYNTVRSFNKPVERTFELPADYDPNKGTTGVVFNEDGSFRHVPTRIVKDESGRYIARVYSMTNSIYGIVERTFDASSVKAHWAAPVLEDFAGRGIIDLDTLDTDAPMTRGAFVETLVVALGLMPETPQTTRFNDITTVGTLSSAAEIAAARGFIKGYDNGDFGAEDTITREQMAQIMANVGAVLAVEADGSESIERFADAEEISGWAKTAMAYAVSAELYRGKSDDTLAPKAAITAAEAIQVLHNLLTQAQLIS